jgi:hypothetical protein
MIRTFRAALAALPLLFGFTIAIALVTLSLAAPALAQAAAPPADLSSLLAILGAAGTPALVGFAILSLAASIVVAVTPTPAPDSPFSRPYQLLEWLALVTRSTKETGIPAVDALHRAQLAILPPPKPIEPAAPTAGSSSGPVAAAILALILLGSSLVACAQLGLTGDPKNDLPIISADVLDTVNKACTDYAPIGALAVTIPDPKVQSIALMTNGVCDVATGQVVPGAASKLDASSAAWVGLSVGMLKALGVTPVATVPAVPAAPPPAAPTKA